MEQHLSEVLDNIKHIDRDQEEFIQAIDEFYTCITPVIEKHPEILANGLIERMSEPERTIIFRVPWVNDQGQVMVNRGYRVQFSSLIGPYKGGLRFSPFVNLSILKALAFEQMFKNALTGFPIGGAKGGSNFNPKGKSDAEIMRFCQSFMTELYRHIGQDVDVPAGDIGVGQREIGYMFGQYKRIRNAYEAGVLTGKGIEYGGSLVRKEATGYGLVYYTNEIFKEHNIDIKGKKVSVSGSGNVAIYAAQKATQLGAKVIAMSDSNGCIHDENGVDLDFIKEIKEVKRGRIKEYLTKHPNAKYIEKTGEDSPIWEIKTDVALPCATENELTLNGAKALVKNGVLAVCEGANLSCNKETCEYLLSQNILVGPAKAANAGGVAISAVEMTQNSMRYPFTFEEVDDKLKVIMANIFKQCKDAAHEYGLGSNYVAGANIAAFTKLSKVMIAQGVV